MSLEWEQTIVDARDPGTLGSWWRDALGWVVVNDDPNEFEIRPAADRLPGLLFVPVPITRAPALTASWTATVPTPPPAPWTTTVCPALRPA